MSERNLETGGKGSINPIAILRDAVKAVPAMKYALAVLGLVAVVAIVTLWRVKYSTAVFGAIIILGLMVPVLVFAKLTKVAPKYFLGPARVFMWAFVILTIAAGTCLFSAAAFRQPSALYELIFSKTDRPPPGSKQSADPGPPKFIAQVVYNTNMVQRTEFETDASRFPSANLDELLTLRRLAYGKADETNRAFQAEFVVKNTSQQPIHLVVNKQFFSITDDKGRSAELLYFCCPSEGDLLPVGEEKVVQLFFRDVGWYGKGISAHAILLRVQGFLPIVSATWKAVTLATAD